MLTRRVFAACALFGAGCSNEAEQHELLPMTIGEWRRTSVEFIPPEEHDEKLKQRGIKQARRATYQGTGRITASVYQFGAPAVAFEMVQQWRTQPNSIALHQGPYFVILKAEQDDNKMLNAFAALLEAVLKTR
jgi:hypothetical protein